MDILSFFPDIVVWKICDYLSFEDLCRLRHWDSRIDRHFRVVDKRKPATLIKRRWKNMITRGRNYGIDENCCCDCNISSIVRCLYQLSYLSCYYFHDKRLRYHTVMPRRRVIIPRCEFVGKVCFISFRSSDLICEMTTVPKTQLFVTANDTVVPVNDDSVIPIRALKLTRLNFVVDDPSRISYICYTEVYLNAMCLDDRDTIEFLNTPALSNHGLLIRTNGFVHKNPHLIP